MTNAWGASPAAWKHFRDRLGWAENLLPVVSNPRAVISADSKMKGLGKTPSQINFRGHAAGMPKWTGVKATAKLLDKWQDEPAHGICVQTGKGLIAIDCDVPDVGLAAAIRETILGLWPWLSWPERYRAGTGKTLFVFAFPFGDLFKRVVPVEGGMIELLGLGQQFIAEGTYINASSGQPDGRYLWRVGAREGWPQPEDVPMLGADQVEELWDLLCLLHGTGPDRRARSTRGPSEGVELPDPGDDQLAAWIGEHWNVLDHDNSGRLYIECPFRGDHTSDSGPTETAYFPAGTGGYQQGHFQCMHAHCADRSDADFRAAIGYERNCFPDLAGGHHNEADVEDGSGERRGLSALREDGERGPLALASEDTERLPGVTGGVVDGKPVAYQEREWPKLARDGNGRIEGTQGNVVKALNSPEMSGFQIAYDEFTAGVVWAPEGEYPQQWRPFKDELYVDLRMILEQRGFKEFSHDRLRSSLHHVAHANAIDTASEWLSRLEWDGVERVNTFLADTLPGVEQGTYSRALGRYLWTGLAGRVLEPGVKADMVPVLVGGEGLRKSSWVKALAPTPETYTDTVSLKHRDNDNSRKMRGRLVLELAELKGMASRDGEEIRAFLAQQYEEWTPKYMEANTTFARRCLMLGTTNDHEFLEARMGMRRLLPMEITGVCDVDRVIADRDQLWAEAAVLFAAGGVDWSVERCAQGEREKFISHDAWMPAVARWLSKVDPVTNMVPASDDRRFTTEDALSAIGVQVQGLDRGKKTRMGAVLTALGCQQKKREGGARAYVLPVEVVERVASFAARDEGNAF